MGPNLLSLYHDEWMRRCLSIASYACLVYDQALTFDKEFEFMWQAPWTFTKAVFLLNRYGNLVCQTIIQTTNLFCDLPIVFTTTYIVFAMESIHIVVLLRAWAIWGCPKRTAMMLIGSYSIYLLILLIRSTIGTISSTVHKFRYANYHQICVLEMPPDTWIIALLTACQDTVVFTITMVSLRRHSKNTIHLYPTSLLFLLTRDAFIFYSSSILFDIFNAVTWVIYPSNPKDVLFLTFAVNLLSIAGQRLVLNLRGFTVRSYGSRSISAEVDRQLQLFGGTQMEWWDTSMSQSDSSRVEHQRQKAGDIEVGTLGHDPQLRPNEGVNAGMPEGKTSSRNNIDSSVGCC